MDRDRLKQVQQTDLTESRVNEDFVNWLKTKAPTYLLVILLVFAGALVFKRWQAGKQAKVNNAWGALADVRGGLPDSIAEVGETHKDIEGVWLLANDWAAGEYLNAIIGDRPLGASLDDLNAPLTADQREDYLRLMSKHYQNLIDSDDGTDAVAIHGFKGRMGLALVAECREDLDEAAKEYRGAASRVEDIYEDLAAFATNRAENVGSLPLDIEFKEAPPFVPDLTNDRTRAQVSYYLSALIDTPFEALEAANKQPEEEAPAEEPAAEELPAEENTAADGEADDATTDAPPAEGADDEATEDDGEDDGGEDDGDDGEGSDGGAPAPEAPE